MRRIALAVAAVLVTASGITGITLATAMSASAQPSCTNSTAFLVDPSPRITVNIPTVGAQTGQDNCLLGVGNDNPGVGVLQNNLNRCHGAHLAVDDIFGQATKAALQAAQRAAHITADGVYGPQTRDHITWIESDGHCRLF
jgi:peptidoglycan hydrolase-like protein with peptidoglycan-binding domain